jgi:uncharacterized glyoxalase superfamily protein PhnB
MKNIKGISMRNLSPYLMFNCNCEEAMYFYELEDKFEKVISELAEDWS